MNEKLKIRIVSGGLSLVLVASGFVFGKLDSKNNSFYEPSNKTIVNEDELINKYLDKYISKRDALEKEIDSLQNQKEKLQNVATFDMCNLIVIENVNEKNESNLFILRTNPTTPICSEYHNEFDAWYRLHPETEEHIFDVCHEYIHFNESQPLINYLTDEEIKTLSNNNGKITTLELDEILSRIRTEHKQQLSKNNHSKNLTKN